MKYEPVIGMECHAELLTESKMFCGCRNAFGGEPNTRCCPVCTGMPGSLPVMNKKAVEHVIRTALALNCSINPNARFDRKNYFYPDLPKGYQISEYDTPIGVKGWLDVEVNGKTTRVHIRRVHLEEDTGKLFHLAGDEDESFVDLNRSGVPLMEIVTDFPPDMHSAEEARTFLMKLRAILTYLEVCDGKMEEGSLRCEPNVSVRPLGSETFGVKTEIKNLNSFRAVQRGIEYEVERQSKLLGNGERVAQETRGWNEAAQATFPQRSKEVEQEYRYFPEPDLVPLDLDAAWIERLRATLPELPDARRARFLQEYSLPAYDAGLLTETRALAGYFEETATRAGDPKAAANWIMGDLTRLLNAHNRDIAACPISPENLAGMIRLIAEGTISGRIAKTLIEEMFATGRPPAQIVEEKGWKTLTDTGAIAALVEKVVADHPQIVADIREKGLVQKKGFLVGQVMQASQGKADPKEVNRLIEEKLRVPGVANTRQ